MKLEDLIAEALKKSVRILPEDIEGALRNAEKTEKGEYAKIVLQNIVKDIDISADSIIPLCQDTGMFWVLVSIGREAKLSSLAKLEESIYKGLDRAQQEAYYRKSVVAEPVFDRPNTKCNLPAVVNYEMVEGKDITISVLNKGFGSENCSGLTMLNPTAGEEGVIDCVIDMVKHAGGKPCPPMFIGVGIGGTADRACFLAKKGLVCHKPDLEKRYQDLELKLMKKINELEIGAGGLGGNNTCLDLNIYEEPTHIAGLPVAISISCWADRKGIVKLEGGFDE